MDRGRHTHLLSTYSKSQELKNKEKVLFTARKEVDINANGTQGYVVKHGPNKGRALAHRPVKSTNNW